MRPLCALAVAAGVLAVSLAAQDLLTQGNEAYRRGDFRAAAEAFEAAAAAEQSPTKRAEIRVKLAWTHFAMKSRTGAETALVAALQDDPTLELVPDYYTDDFLALFARVRARASTPPPPRPTAPPAPRPTPPTPLAGLRAQLAQAADASALEKLLAEVHRIEGDTLGAALPDVLDLKAEVLERLDNPQAALEQRGRAAALRAAALAAPGTTAVPLEALLEGRRLLGDGRPLDAAALMKGVLTAQPSSTPALEVLGEAYLAAGQISDARSAVKTALLAGEKAELLMVLGEVELALGRSAAARDALRRAVELDPGSDRAWAALGLTAARLGDRAAAREALDKALQNNATLFEARVVRAQLALLDGQAQAATSHLQRALQVRPDDAWATGWLFVTALEANSVLPGKFPDRSDGEPTALSLARAESLRRAGKADQALTELAGAGEDTAVQLLRARSLLDSGQAAEARGLLEAARQADPSSATVLYLLGVACHRLADWSGAEAAFARAAALAADPTLPREALVVSRATRHAQELMATAVAVPPPAPTR